jgi:hypothetical protein
MSPTGTTLPLNPRILARTGFFTERQTFARRADDA